MKRLNQIMRLIVPFLIMLVLLAVVIINIISPKTNFNFIPVLSKKAELTDSAYLASLPIIDKYEKVKVYGEPVLEFKENSLINFISPKTENIIDNLYALSGILICLIFCTNFWKHDNSKIFTSKLLNTILWTKRVLQVAWLLNILRHWVLRKHFLEITNDEYLVDNFPFIYPEFWLFLFSMALQNIIKQGLKLQKEQELTV